MGKGMKNLHAVFPNRREGKRETGISGKAKSGVYGEKVKRNENPRVLFRMC